MSHEGRMARGEANFNSGNKKLQNNADTLYYLENKSKQEKEEVEQSKPQKKTTKK